MREVPEANKQILARLVMAPAPVQTCPFISTSLTLCEAVVMLDLTALKIWDASFLLCLILYIFNKCWWLNGNWLRSILLLCGPLILISGSIREGHRFQILHKTQIHCICMRQVRVIAQFFFQSFTYYLNKNHVSCFLPSSREVTISKTQAIHSLIQFLRTFSAPGIILGAGSSRWMNEQVNKYVPVTCTSDLSGEEKVVGLTVIRISHRTFWKSSRCHGQIAEWHNLVPASSLQSGQRLPKHIRWL